MKRRRAGVKEVKERKGLTAEAGAERAVRTEADRGRDTAVGNTPTRMTPGNTECKRCL